jgi:hypothetical protein
MIVKELFTIIGEMTIYHYSYIYTHENKIYACLSAFFNGGPGLSAYAERAIKNNPI